MPDEIIDYNAADEAINNFFTSTLPANSDLIPNSLKKINEVFGNLHTAASAMRIYFNNYENANFLYDEYLDRYNQFLLTDSKYAAKYFDFVTTVQTNSAKWLQPLSINYPTLLEEPVDFEKIVEVNNWLRRFFPIKNEDGSLNYVEKQIFYVNCYSYTYQQPINVLAQPYSYCNCQTQSGDIYLHCKTKITGGWIHCNQGKYLCDKTIDCYPKKSVDCWYETPYLHTDSTRINTTDAISTKQSVISKIQANITMNYTERRETDIKTFIFRVYNCDWDYVGEVNRY